jgi:hypothetical protein
MGIKQYFFDKRIKAAKEKSLQYKANTSLLKVKNVLIFIDDTTTFNQKYFRSLREQLDLDIANFVFLTYKDKKSNYNEFSGVVVTQDSFNWKGNVTSESLQELLSKEFDLLIDYTQNKLEIKQLIVPIIKAAFKVSFSDEFLDLYDFVVETPPDGIKTFNTEMVRYLKILKLI